MKEETIKLSVGDVVLIEPSAFIRNNALIKAETEAVSKGARIGSTTSNRRYISQKTSMPLEYR